MYKENKQKNAHKKGRDTETKRINQEEGEKLK
jgi:hypothetical protein